MFKIIREWSGSFISPFAEAVKEAFRVTLFSVPGQLILWLEDKDLAYKAIIVNLILIFLRALDKYLYEASKNRGVEKGSVVSGLSPI